MNREPKALVGDDDPLELDLEELLALTAHELHEPLRKISAFGEMLKDRAGPSMDAESLDYLERIERATGRMRTTLTRVIAFARVPRGLPFVTIDLGEVVAGAIEKQREPIAQAGARVEVGPLPSIDGDPFQMQLLFEQLLDNSVKFRREDVPLVVKIDAPGPPSGWQEVRVADNGEGFDDTYAERIFRPFERLHGRGKFDGAGLGLSICQKIAQRHGGRVAARGTPGEGAVMTVTLPAAKARGRAAQGQSAS
ncbi:MAG: ATP-binding protein [Polyangiaceae bacterium]